MCDSHKVSVHQVFARILVIYIIYLPYYSAHESFKIFKETFITDYKIFVFKTTACSWHLCNVRMYVDVHCMFTSYSLQYGEKDGGPRNTCFLLLRQSVTMTTVQ